MLKNSGRKPQPRKLTMSDILRSLETEEPTPTEFVSTKAATEPQTRVVHQECWTTLPTRQPHGVHSVTPTPRRDVTVTEKPFRQPFPMFLGFFVIFRISHSHVRPNMRMGFFLSKLRDVS